MDEDKRMEEGTNSPHNEYNLATKLEINSGGDSIEHGTLEVESFQQPKEEIVKQKTTRVATLDAFRGLTIVLMILVNDAGEAYPRIDHSPWNGCNLADFVMPFFLFIVGVAIALALKRIPKVKVTIKRIILRTLKLLFWGLLLEGGYLHARDDLSFGVDMEFIQWCGVLQRIAFVYCVVALIETFTTKLRPTTLSPGYLSIFTSYKWQWFGGFVAFVIYMVTTLSLYVPDWSFVDYNSSKPKRYTVICGMRGHLGPACNAVGYVDRQIWGVNHLYPNPVLRRLKACTFSSPAYGPLRKEAPAWCRAPFEPEGLLSSISAILSSTIGIHYGHVLIHFKLHSERLKQWLSMGFVLLLLGITLHFTNAIPINKQLYSFSFVCVTSGAAGIVFSVLYILVNWIQNHVFINVWHSERLGTLLYVIFAEITFWGVVAGILHKLGIYWKL